MYKAGQMNEICYFGFINDSINNHKKLPVKIYNRKKFAGDLK